jgi:phage tail-like protein
LRSSNPEIQKPYGSSNFLVDLGIGDPHGYGAGFCEVIIPEFRLDLLKKPAASRRQSIDRDGARGTSRYLILRRGVTGTLDLYSWWDKARKGKAPRERTVTVSLLAQDFATVIFTWYFHHARPVSLSYSPLNALQGGVLIETIELEFKTVEMR